MLFRKIRKFDGTIDHGEGPMNPSCQVKQAKHSRREVSGLE